MLGGTHNYGVPRWLRRWRIRLQCWRPGFNPWIGKISWRRAWQYSCLENPMDRGAWWATVPGGAKSRPWPSSWTMSTHRELQLVPLYRWKNQNSEMLSNFPRVTQLVRGKTQACTWFSNPKPMLLISLLCFTKRRISFSQKQSTWCQKKGFQQSEANAYVLTKPLQ